MAAAPPSGLGSAQPPAQLLPRKASAAEVVIIIGDGAVTYTGVTVIGFEFRGVIVIQTNITSLRGLTERRRSIVTQSGTACIASVLTIPTVEPISGTTAFGIHAPDGGMVSGTACTTIGIVTFAALATAYLGR